MKKLLSILAIVLFYFAISLNHTYAQPCLFEVQTLNMEQGLPDRMVGHILQDHKGYIWVSGRGHISRYDGTEWKVYNYSQLNTLQQLKTFLAVDKQNRLWYAESRDGAYSAAIDANTDEIIALQNLSDGLLHSDSVVFVNNSRINENQILIATQNGKVYTYEDDFELIYTVPNTAQNGFYIVVEEGNEEDYFIFTHDFETAEKEILHVKDKQLKNRFDIPDNYYYRLTRVFPNGMIEIYSGGDYEYYKLQNDSLVMEIKTQFLKPPYRIIELNEAYECRYTQDNRVLVFDNKDNLIYEKKVNAGATAFRRSVFKDKQNIIWLATDNGIVKILPQKNNFEIINKSTVYKGNSIRGIYQDEEYLWWGGYGENLKRNLQTGEIEQLLIKENSTVPLNFLKDHQGNFWVGSTHSLYYEYLLKEDTFLRHQIPELHSLLFQNRITKNYWVGTQNGWFTGTLGGEITRFPIPGNMKNVYVRQFYQNDAGVWVLTGNGLFLMDGQSEKLIKHYTINDGLSSNNLNYMYQDADDVYWIGTKDTGLLSWDRNNNKFKRFTKDNYLVNNNIYCIYEDEFNRLWLPSDNGLMCFDKATYNVRVFLEKDGIAHKEFNTYSYFKAKDGTFYFGGVEGITKFHPKDIGSNDYKIPLHMNQVRILAVDDSEFRDETTAYSNTQKIELSPQDRSLELKPSLLDYKNTGAKQLAYQFNNQQWTYTNDKTISIMNPSYGNYQLSIKVKTITGEWSDVLEIPLLVKAPFYRRIWFWLLAGLLTLGLIFLFARQRIKRLEKDRTRLESEVKKRTRQIEADKKTIEKQANELLQLDQAKSRFFSNITHEFRTPLTLVTGPVEKILAKNLSEDLRHPLRGVLKNARSLLGLINQLLDIAKLESAQMQIEISRGDIVAFTKNLVYQFEPLAATKQIDLAFKTEKQKWETYFDKDKWTKIVSNLVSNAIKFTNNNGLVYIELKNIYKDEKDTIHIIVKDNGQGISPAYLPKIFDRFSRNSDHSHTIGGTGIGLALVKELIDLQHGEISVESIVDEGTSFVVQLPVADASLAANYSYTPPTLVDLDLADYSIDAKVEVSSNDENKLELLIVEDNTEMRSFIRSCVNEQTYNISEAADGEAGIRKANETVPDLIISDIMMPKKDGFEVVQAIRQNLATSHIPIILLTAKASLESRMEGFERGADAFMSKPFSPNELNLRVRKLIEIRMMLQARYQSNLPSDSLKGFQKEDAFIEELKAYITENIENTNLTGEVIGRQFGMSRMQLHRKLKALIQCTPAEYVRIIRLETAMQLLQTNGLNVSEVAYQTGFSSPAHFSRVFKKMYGLSPSEVVKS